MAMTDRPAGRDAASDHRNGFGATVPAALTATSQLSDALRTFVRHRWWALGGFVALCVPLVVVTLTTIPVYRATTTLLVSDDQPAAVGLTEREGGAAKQSGVLDPRTQTEVVRSRGLIRETVGALRLWEAPGFAAGTPRATFIGRAWDGLRGRNTPSSNGTDEERAQQFVDVFLGQLSIDVPLDSRLMALSFEAPDPALAARAANELATRYIERDRESRFKAASGAATWFAGRLAEQRQQVAASETVLQKYRESQDALSLADRQNIVVQRLGDVNAAVTKAKTDRITKETQFRQLEALAKNETALESHPMITANAFVQSLKAQAADLARQEEQFSQKYGPRHPQMIQARTARESVQAKLRAEIVKVVEGARGEYLAAQVQEQSLTNALNAQKGEAVSLDRKGVEYASLEREAASARQVFDALLQQTKEAALSSDLQRSAVRVVDAAEPPGAPIRPRQTQGLATAGILGLLGAVGAAFGREYLRKRIVSPHDIERHLGLPVLALIPAVDEQADVEHVGALPPAAAEAFRRLRTSIMLSREGSTEGQVLVVTSTAPREGKTIVAAHLASMLAAANLRVALIDADLRRPRLHTLFDRKQEPGLTEVLLDRRSRTEVVLRGASPGPVLIPSGATTENASELLSLPTFKQFVDSLRKDFDWLVIDSPPVMAVTDAAVLAHGASAVLFVTCADKTTIEAADAAITELAAVGARFVGAVLNRVPLTREAYYYSRYYRPEYSAYFAPQRGPLGALTRGTKRPVEVVTGRAPAASSGAPGGESISPSL